MTAITANQMYTDLENTRSRAGHSCMPACIPFACAVCAVVTIVSVALIAGLNGDGAVGVSGIAMHALVLGDYGRMGNANQTEVADQMQWTAYRLDIAFIASTGDNFYPAGVSSVRDAQFQASWFEVYTGALRAIPWYLVAGNHDWLGNVTAEVRRAHMLACLRLASCRSCLTDGIASQPTRCNQRVATQVAYSAKNHMWNFPSTYYMRTERVASGVCASFVHIDTTQVLRDDNPGYVRSTVGAPAPTGTDAPL